jgi:hypothetical protein
MLAAVQSRSHLLDLSGELLGLGFSLVDGREGNRVAASTAVSVNRDPLPAGAGLEHGDRRKRPKGPFALIGFCRGALIEIGQAVAQDAASAVERSDCLPCRRDRKRTQAVARCRRLYRERHSRSFAPTASEARRVLQRDKRCRQRRYQRRDRRGRVSDLPARRVQPAPLCPEFASASREASPGFRYRQFFHAIQSPNVRLDCQMHVRPLAA